MGTLPRQSEPETLLAEIEPALSTIDQTSFSQAAFSALKIRMAQYIADLIDESGKARQRDRSDIISVKHVETASEHLKQSSRNKLYKQSGMLGGILFGACLSNLYSILTTNQITLSGTVLTVILGILGAVFLMIGIMGE